MAHPAPSGPSRRIGPSGLPTEDPVDNLDKDLDDVFDDDPPIEWTARLGELRHRLGLDVRLLAWGVAAILAAGVAAWLLRPAPAPFEETLPTASSEPVAAGATPGGSEPVGPTTTAVPTEVVAHAAGAVARPGIYRLDPTARVDDLVRAAGGLAPDADGARLNLAAPLTDGARVYVPRVGEEAPPEVAGPDVPAGGGQGASPDESSDAPININTADEAALDELPGVGPAIAGAIVTYRTENGAFSSFDELLDVRGIGEAKLADITPLATV
ncbi:hypothetical protein BH24ACT4_BH24ACT4_16040 [soil metagenome]